MKSNKYDQLMIKTLGDSHIKKGTVYYDGDYENALKKELKKYGLLEKYKGELTQNSKGTKMCSIASSSRLCFLASRSIIRGKVELERTDIKNGCCNPHFDAYSNYGNEFFEFKCHELCSEKHSKLTSMKYIPLLKEVFGIECSDPKELKFSDFGLRIDNDPYINEINFDFKQFICHIFGLLSIAKKTKKTKLTYIWITPYDPKNTELNDFIDFINNQIDNVFEQVSELTVHTKSESGKLREFIEFNCEIVSADDIPDFVLESID